MSLLTDLSWTRTGDGGLRLRRQRFAARGSLRVLRAGICGTDLQIQRGVRPDGASVLGHEGLAEHCAPDGPVRGVFNPVDPADQDRILGHSYDGVFRRRYPEAPEDLVRRGLVRARADLAADLTVLAEPLGAVLYGWELLGAGAAPTGTVGVWGSGTTAVLAALVGELRGVPTVLTHPRRERLEYLRRREVLATTRLTDGAPGGVTAAFVCLPREAAGEAFTQAARSVEEDAPIDLFGGFGTGTRHPLTGDLDLNSVRRSNVCGALRSGGARPVTLTSGKRVRLTGHRGTSPGQLLRAQDLLAAYPERFGRVLSHVLSLEAAGPALRSMATDPPGRRLIGEHLKVLIDPTMPAGTTRTPDLLTTVADLPHHC